MKRFNSLIIILLCALLAFPRGVIAADESTRVSARAAVLYDPLGGRWLYEKNADTQMPMASTTKVMTAMVALRLLDLDTVYEIPPEACGKEGSSLYLQKGDKLSVRDLLYGLLLRSANDAASALAVLACGSEEAFANEMNAEARRLGLKNTSFKNPHGLDAEGHYSCARDLALILSAAMEDERFARICKCAKYTVTLEGRAQVLYNHNKLLNMSGDVVGGKTGFTKKSGRCLVSAAERNGVHLIAVTLSAPDDWNDHLRLFDMGFASLERRQIISVNDALHVNVAGGTKDKLRCRPTDDLFAVTEKNATVTCDVLLPSVIFAPVKKGDTVGIIVAYDGDVILGKICLAADEDTEIKQDIKSRSLLDKLRELFKK